MVRVRIMFRVSVTVKLGSGLGLGYLRIRFFRILPILMFPVLTMNPLCVSWLYLFSLF